MPQSQQTRTHNKLLILNQWVITKYFYEYKTMVSPCAYAGLITFLLSRNVSWECEDAAILQARRGNQIFPTYLTHPYIMNKEFRIFIIY
ncbi:hypothetical protein FIB67_17150 [Escherichia coli]|nr:hypothetical protein FIB67_17150 [Escherichia coli]